MPISKQRTSTRLSHLGSDGSARMVDVSGKASTQRTATARARVTLSREAFAALVASENAKGDALAVARLAGIQAAKRTSEWIPLCHPLLFDSVDVVCARKPRARAVEILATVRGEGRTGYGEGLLGAATAAGLTG